MTSISEYASPRCYRRHQRHARLARTRFSGQLTGFLDNVATGLSLTTAQAYDYLYYNSADALRAAVAAGSTSQLVPVPASFTVPGPN